MIDMKKIIIDYDKIVKHKEVDLSLLKEGFIFNECGLIVNDIPGSKYPFKIGLQFYPDRTAVYISVYGPKFEIITYYLGYNLMNEKGFLFGRMDKDITNDNNEIDAAYELISMAMDACMTIKDAAYERAVTYKKNEEDLTEDLKILKRMNKLKKRHKLQNVFLMDDLIMYMATTLPEEKLKRHMNCPVWEVRGFYRHYKNGTVKWINSFQKGRDRNKGLSGKDRTYIADKRDKNI